MGETRPFTPMWASPPGRTIRTRLDEIGLDVPEFADRLGTPADVALGLLDGRETITIDLARRLSSILGASPEFWVTRDCQYRDDLVRVETSQWLEEMPVREMARFGWIPPQSGWVARAEACLSFFGVKDLAQWRSAYEPVLAATRMRISAAVPSRPPAVAAWLRQATREAEAVATASWDATALRDSLGGVKALTWSKDPGIFVPRLRSLLAQAGVALVVLRALPGCPASGAALFLSPNRAMIAVSGRFLADDQFWFTVTHEIAHLLLHHPDHAILDDPSSPGVADTPEEQEANRFAAETLLPASIRAGVAARSLTARDVISVARAAGIAPGIVVGQLQFAGLIGYDQLNTLKRRYRWNGPNLGTA
jgi:HTH-type transcriptional regulator / antitoxin HigA